MSNEQGVSRRKAIQMTAKAGLVLAGGSMLATAPKAAAAAVPKYKNADFYDKSGKLLTEKARDAYFTMMKRFNYPIPPSLKKGMWATDFGLGDFIHAGMGGIMWWNNEKYSYFGHEIFLLPGQMIVEHGHNKTEKVGAKMEAWHVRHGMIYTFGEGPETSPLPVKPAESQIKYITVKNCAPLMPGEVRELNRPEAKHFMLAGPEGAIVTEYATYHAGDALRFTNPGVKF